MITHSELLIRLRYDRETGKFIRLSRRNGVVIGELGEAFTSITPNGYSMTAVAGKRYLTHRLAYFYENGRWPEKTIDHINGIKTDNRIDNLRDATQSENNANQSIRFSSTSGYKGVTKRKRKDGSIRYEARMGQTVLGSFDEPEEASMAYCMEAIKTFGEYANAG